MSTKNQQKNNPWKYLLAFLLVGFFFFAAQNVLAIKLEVHYPTISGQTLGESSKLPDYAKYLFDAGMFLGFFSVLLSLITAGVMYLLAPMKPDAVSAAKDRASGAVSGLLILTMTYLIITTINPALSVFKVNEPPAQQTTPPEEKKSPGVYFFKTDEADCANKNKTVKPYTSSTPNLGDLKNKVQAVDIIHDPDTETSYISILYDQVDYWGKCQYIDPNKNCLPLDNPFPASASVHQYDFKPNGDGVYFYRKPNFDEKGGYYKVDNSEISGKIYIEELQKLKFKDVPEEEQDCKRYDKNGECAKDAREAPTLAGENILSVKIKGNYLVLFIYFGPEDKEEGPWTFCQKFPTIDDVDRLGPQQMKWQHIRNNEAGIVPNYVAIIPIQGGLGAGGTSSSSLGATGQESNSCIITLPSESDQNDTEGSTAPGSGTTGGQTGTGGSNNGGVGGTGTGGNNSGGSSGTGAGGTGGTGGTNWDSNTGGATGAGGTGPGAIGGGIGIVGGGTGIVGGGTGIVGGGTGIVGGPSGDSGTVGSSGGFNIGGSFNVGGVGGNFNVGNGGVGGNLNIGGNQVGGNSSGGVGGFGVIGITPIFDGTRFQGFNFAGGINLGILGINIGGNSRGGPNNFGGSVNVGGGANFGGLINFGGNGGANFSGGGGGVNFSGGNGGANFGVGPNNFGISGGANVRRSPNGRSGSVNISGGLNSGGR